MEKTIAILGAGPAGLGAAWELKRLGYEDFVVLEAKDHPGGLSSSERDSRGQWWDFGGHVAYLRSAEFTAMLKALFFEHELYRHPQRRVAYINGLWVRFPVQQHLTDFPIEDQLKFEQDKKCLPKSPRHDNLLAWLLDSFGPHLCGKFMLPYNRKLWRTPLDQMSAKWCTGIIPAGENTGPAMGGPGGQDISAVYPTSGGIGEIWRRLANFIGGSVMFKHEVHCIAEKYSKLHLHVGSNMIVQCKVIISSLPLPAFATICSDILPDLINLTGKLCFVSVGVRHNAAIALTAPLGTQRIYIVDGTSSYRWSTPHSSGYPSIGSIEYAVSDQLGYDRFEQYAYPVPKIGRDPILKEISDLLHQHKIKSIGRMGGWCFEYGHMDQCFIQGVEAAREAVNV